MVVAYGNGLCMVACGIWCVAGTRCVAEVKASESLACGWVGRGTGSAGRCAAQCGVGGAGQGGQPRGWGAASVVGDESVKWWWPGRVASSTGGGAVWRTVASARAARTGAAQCGTGAAAQRGAARVVWQLGVGAGCGAVLGLRCRCAVRRAASSGCGVDCAVQDKKGGRENGVRRDGDGVRRLVVQLEREGAREDGVRRDSERVVRDREGAASTGCSQTLASVAAVPI